jgi:hypothetical protein
VVEFLLDGKIPVEGRPRVGVLAVLLKVWTFFFLAVLLFIFRAYMSFFLGFLGHAR